MSLTRVQFFSISLDGFGTGEGQTRDLHFGHADDSTAGCSRPAPGMSASENPEAPSASTASGVKHLLLTKNTL